MRICISGFYVHLSDWMPCDRKYKRSADGIPGVERGSGSLWNMASGQKTKGKSKDTQSKQKIKRDLTLLHTLLLLTSGDTSIM